MFVFPPITDGGEMCQSRVRATWNRGFPSCESISWISCKGEWLTVEGSVCIKVSEASCSHEGHSLDNLTQRGTHTAASRFHPANIAQVRTLM